jgi:ankyrin repeat protein
MRLLTITAVAAALLAEAAPAQTPPSPAEIAAYGGLHAAAAQGRPGDLPGLIASGLDPNGRDGNGRTPLHVAAFLGRTEAMRALVTSGADPNALDAQAYDIVTILAVKDDVSNLAVALSLGASARNVTSPWKGTALIAAAHLGHDGAVRALIAAGAPLDHVNTLTWTAVIEAIVLGDGGPRHQACLAALIGAGANLALADAAGRTPLALARSRGHAAMARMLEQAGAP